ncbi:hypothetical protein BKA70DRAFT_1231350 [Coprinopsis sp. MPI-PUGE-AT-0042]|nr:hypothetical protein BKA70DRAFT_1231350 [Coprinopsis sp. MPI-PUGE-AT-0042]
MSIYGTKKCLESTTTRLRLLPTSRLHEQSETIERTCMPNDLVHRPSYFSSFPMRKTVFARNSTSIIPALTQVGPERRHSAPHAHLDFWSDERVEPIIERTKSRLKGIMQGCKQTCFIISNTRQAAAASFLLRLETFGAYVHPKSDTQQDSNLFELVWGWITAVSKRAADLVHGASSEVEVQISVLFASHSLEKYEVSSWRAVSRDSEPKKVHWTGENLFHKIRTYLNECIINYYKIDAPSP